MNKHSRYLSLVIILSVFSLSSLADNSPSKNDLTSEANDIVKTFAGMLQPKLKQAIQSGGLEHAIEVCSVEAPKIASNLSAQTGWNIKRVSLKPRNKTTAMPDDFEIKILEQFNELQAKVGSQAVMEYSEIVGKRFRYMKAQAVEGICLNCHGNSVPENVKKLIDLRYPEDSATGYSLGQIRGAFSLIKDL